MSGFYLMHRGWMEHHLFAGEAFTRAQAWEWLIQEASFEPHKIKHPNKMEIVTVQRGQVAITYSSLRTKWKWSNDKIRNFLLLLQSDAMITLETGRGFTIITICKYDEYQRPQKENRTHIGTHIGRTSVRTSVHHIDKELKELKEYSSLSAPEFIKSIFDRLEKIINSPTPLFSSPIAKWLEWGADPELDIIPAAERWKKKNPTTACNSLSWLDEDVARSLKQRTNPMPSVNGHARASPQEAMSLAEVNAYIASLNGTTQ